MCSVSLCGRKQSTMHWCRKIYWNWKGINHNVECWCTHNVSVPCKQDSMQQYDIGSKWDQFYLSLHHVWTIQSHPVHKVISVNCVFFLKLLKQHIQCNDGACPAHTSTERDGTKVKQVMYRYSHQQVILKIKLQQALQLTYSSCNIKTEVVLYLQWTTVGAPDPSLCMCCLISCLNSISSFVHSGTPWSGQTVKWKCFTVRCSVVLLWRFIKENKYMFSPHVQCLIDDT